jgi:cellulose synthase/poly-beta-1,6-N-acetylglucosamine synthase-like glycosyltransferase
MAFPWEVIRSANLATGAAVEDLKLGLDLARTGRSAVFCPDAVVNSSFPTSTKGTQSQRKRWEQGHLGMIAAYIPTLLYESVVKLDFRLLALLLDLAVPPLTLLGILEILIVAASALAVLCGFSPSPLFVSTAAVSAYLMALILSWCKFGRDSLPPSAIVSVVSYVVKKLPIYRQIVSHGRTSEWIRTDRAKSLKDGK